MTISIETIKEIIYDSNPYKLFIYKSLDYISTNDLIDIDPRKHPDKFYDVLKIEEPLLYEYESDGYTKFTVLALYKVNTVNDSIGLSTVFRVKDYYDSSLFNKMKINIVLKGIIKDKINIPQIKVQFLDHNNKAYDTHKELIEESLNDPSANKIHYNKNLTKLINSVNYLNLDSDFSILGSNVLVDNDSIRKTVRVNTLCNEEVPIIYNNDYVGQILASANDLPANIMASSNLLKCDGSFVSIDTYPELYHEIGDMYLFDVELYAKIIESGNILAEYKYNELTEEQKKLIVELFNVKVSVLPQEGKFKLPSKQFLGLFNPYKYYIKYQTSLNTLNALIIKNINNIPVKNNSIQLTTSDIPEGTNLYFHKSYLDPINTQLKDLDNRVPTVSVVSVAGIKPDLINDDSNPNNIKIKGNVPLKIEDLGGCTSKYVNDLIKTVTLDLISRDQLQINKQIYKIYPKKDTDTFDKFAGFHIDSTDIYYKKELILDNNDEEIGRNPNDPTYQPKTIYDIIEDIKKEYIKADGSIPLNNNLNMNNQCIKNVKTEEINDALSFNHFIKELKYRASKPNLLINIPIDITKKTIYKQGTKENLLYNDPVLLIKNQMINDGYSLNIKDYITIGETFDQINLAEKLIKEYEYALLSGIFNGTIVNNTNEIKEITFSLMSNDKIISEFKSILFPKENIININFNFSIIYLLDLKSFKIILDNKNNPNDIQIIDNNSSNNNYLSTNHIRLLLLNSYININDTIQKDKL